ncbi:trypsin-1 [Tetranychus urticae]|uniref:Peptidase S1 domain-containing protein n=1 Tax=Tetranychus urticae TaxID=32264 RepID=T1KHC8_TETUR|nr:trypsin-1 [Tetranychus urticae]
MLSLLLIILLSQCYLSVCYEKLNCNCGIEGIDTKVVNGREAIPNNYRWMAAISDLNLQNVFCGGTLINNRYIITAGHCFTEILDRSTIRIILGAHDLTKMENVTVYKADKVIVHEKYEPNSSHQRFDIALIKLNKNVTFTDKIGPICLPPRNMRQSFDSLKISGWGSLGEGLETSTRLMEVVVKERPLAVCQKLLGSERVTVNHICAGDSKYDSCSGDSGGPLMTKIRGRVYLVGIVSWGIECAHKNYPGVYTRVSSYGLWIYQNSQEALYCNNKMPLNETAG